MNVAHLEQTIRWDRSNRDPKHRGLETELNKLCSILCDTSLIESFVRRPHILVEREGDIKGEARVPFVVVGVGRPPGR